MENSNHMRHSVSVKEECIEELREIFKQIDIDDSGFISVSELTDALALAGLRIPAYEVRNIIEKADTNIKNGQLDFEEFKQMFATVKNQCDWGSKFLTQIITRSGLDNYGGMSATSAEGTTHTVKKEEQIAFSDWINRKLAKDSDCKKYLPLDPESRDLYIKCSDGIIFCKLINLSQPGTIDERAINKDNMSIYHSHENLTLALTSAQSIGCNIVNIGPEDLKTGRPHLVLGLLWQIIRIGLISDINLFDHPGLVLLVDDGSTLEDFQKLSPEEILLRWVNYHLSRSSCGRRIANFGPDISDSVAYIHLLHRISPKEAKVTLDPERVSDQLARAEATLKEAEKIGCRSFISAQDIVDGNQKLNLAFVANLFNNYAALDITTEEMPELERIMEETREEKSYRNWMNSMGVSPYVNHLYSDLSDGLVILQLYDVIRPGVVKQNRVIKDFHRMKEVMEKIENCNYVVELGKSSKFSLVGIDGKDIYDCNRTLTLALIWQLMKAYTISILSKLAGSKELITDKEIIDWVNDKLKKAKKTTSLNSFSDASISDVHVLLDVIDACKKGAVNYGHVKTGNSEQDKLDRAKYAITTARKIGAGVYALPEDIVEVKSRMVMTVFACLMINDLHSKTSGDMSG